MRSHLARIDGDSTEVQFLSVTGERCAVPVHLVLLTAALLLFSGAVDERHRQPATVRQAPATRLPPRHHRRVPAPVVWGETLENDANIRTCINDRQQAEQGENAPLTAAKRASLLQEVIKGRHYYWYQRFLCSGSQNKWKLVHHKFVQNAKAPDPRFSRGQFQGWCLSKQFFALRHPKNRLSARKKRKLIY